MSCNEAISFLEKINDEISYKLRELGSSNRSKKNNSVKTQIKPRAFALNIAQLNSARKNLKKITVKSKSPKSDNTNEFEKIRQKLRKIHSKDKEQHSPIGLHGFSPIKDALHKGGKRKTYKKTKSNQLRRTVNRNSSKRRI